MVHSYTYCREQVLANSQRVFQQEKINRATRGLSCSRQGPQLEEEKKTLNIASIITNSCRCEVPHDHYGKESSATYAAAALDVTSAVVFVAALFGLRLI